MYDIRRVSFFEKVHIDYPFSSVEVLNIFSVATLWLLIGCINAR